MFIVAALIFPLSSIWVKNFKNSLCGNALSGNGNGDADDNSEDIKPRDNGDATVCFKMWKLISNIQVLFFLLVSIVNGMGNATYDIYIILRLKQLNASYVLIGFTAGLGSLTNFCILLHYANDPEKNWKQRNDYRFNADILCQIWYIFPHQ